MTRREFYLFVKDRLIDIYGDREASSMGYILLEYYCGVTKNMALIDPDVEVSMADFGVVENGVERLQNFEPIQHITGVQEFYGREFFVNENVLIPRPETEELVAMIICNHVAESDINPISILDIGTGSGAIATTLAAEVCGSVVTTIDISERAIETAKKTANRYGVDVEFLCEDILKQEVDSLKDRVFDLIVSNPPYIAYSEIVDMSRNVVDYEPHLALFVDDDDPLLFYRRIATLGKQHLKKGGVLYFEINERFGEQTVDMLKDCGYLQITLHRDLNGKDRLVKAVKGE